MREASRRRRGCAPPGGSLPKGHDKEVRFADKKGVISLSTTGPLWKGPLSGPHHSNVIFVLFWFWNLLSMQPKRASSFYIYGPDRPKKALLKSLRENLGKSVTPSKCFPISHIPESAQKIKSSWAIILLILAESSSTGFAIYQSQYHNCIDAIQQDLN